MNSDDEKKFLKCFKVTPDRTEDADVNLYKSQSKVPPERTEDADVNLYKSQSKVPPHPVLNGNLSEMRHLLEEHFEADETVLFDIDDASPVQTSTLTLLQEIFGYGIWCNGEVRKTMKDLIIKDRNQFDLLYRLKDLPYFYPNQLVKTKGRKKDYTGEYAYLLKGMTVNSPTSIRDIIKASLKMEYLEKVNDEPALAELMKTRGFFTIKPCRFSELGKIALDITSKLGLHD